ncbi:hypothetical protein MYCTH_2312176 [Thermothelomyces thermophilus ATCC 42464]|uniref:Chromosome transmission fidelity protein 8 n=1 Tax=Thermothelomyces thermophilus (strain ATCC 42464 / BCRC 31852 / DSM 1799) TaxID=573729 RepID=G2QQ54_THET4|nr:uncharacterized protein MYCTH_2312176 [Thermothelomyces thermophilus ATCC 42464]AEO61717.1 hypothetical protein MYCTH_2312176 [Thermothelomyces thermophilus ATCC 42464]
MSTPTKAIPLHPRPHNPSGPFQNRPSPQSPLPPLLQTPSGLALLELQGTINLPPLPPETAQDPASATTPAIPIGRLHFPDYDGSADSTAWTNRVWMYVGEHQRLQGQVKKLPRAVAVLRKRRGGRSGLGTGGPGPDEGEGAGRRAETEAGTEELEVVDIVKWKIVFSSRPEPVGSGAAS